MPDLKEIRDALDAATPGHLVVRLLSEAVKHLLDDHDCDADPHVDWKKALVDVERVEFLLSVVPALMERVVELESELSECRKRGGLPQPYVHEGALRFVNERAERYRKALELLADPLNWTVLCDVPGGPYIAWDAKNHPDDIARQALRGEEE